MSRSKQNLAAADAQLRKLALLFVGSTVWVLAIGGIVWSLTQPQQAEKLWLIMGPMLSSALTGMPLR
jgi:hypothetical protein